jgi:hypothetical protein
MPGLWHAENNLLDIETNSYDGYNDVEYPHWEFRAGI